MKHFFRRASSLVLTPYRHRAGAFAYAALAVTACGKQQSPAVAPQPVAAVPAAESPAAPTGAVPAAGALTEANAPAAGNAALPPGHPPIAAAGAEIAIPADLAVADLKIGDLNAKAAEYKGKSVAVRGIVVKINRAILGKNWVHVKDASGEILVTSATGDAPVGARVLAKGAVATDQDFGAGYKYAVLIADGSIDVEAQPAAPTGVAPALPPGAAAGGLPPGHPPIPAGNP